MSKSVRHDMIQCSPKRGSIPALPLGHCDYKVQRVEEFVEEFKSNPKKSATSAGFHGALTV